MDLVQIVGVWHSNINKKCIDICFNYNCNVRSICNEIICNLLLNEIVLF
jgi:hypothetical protein